MAALKMVLEGDKAMRKKLEGIAREFPLAARRGTREVANQLLAKSQERVPVKSGDLRDSGKVRVSIRKKVGGENIAATLVYGGGGVLYARKVHEDLEAKHPNGGQAKYLESVLLESVSTIGGDLSREIDLKKVAMEAR